MANDRKRTRLDVSNRQTEKQLRAGRDGTIARTGSLLCWTTVGIMTNKSSANRSHSRRSSRGANGGVASRYLAAISGGASNDDSVVATMPAHSAQPLHTYDLDPTLKSPTTSYHRRSPLASSLASPQSTKTERTFPLDQSATSASSCDERQSTWNSPSRGRGIPTQAPFDTSASPIVSAPSSRVRRHPLEPLQFTPSTSNGNAVNASVVVQDVEMSDQSSLSASKHDHNLSHTSSVSLEQPEPASQILEGDDRRGNLEAVKHTSQHSSRWSGGLRFFLDAKQIWSGCEYGNHGNTSLDVTEASHESEDIPNSEGFKLERTLSEIKSEVTTATTQVATNRAADVARQRILAQRALASATGGASNTNKQLTSSQPVPLHPASQSSYAAQRSYARKRAQSKLHPSRYSFGQKSSQWNPAQLEATSVLSVSSNDESSSRAAFSQDEICVDVGIRNGTGLSPSAPSIQSSNRLSRHVTMQQQRVAATTQALGGISKVDHVCEYSYHSQSSSTGVEVDSHFARHNESSTSRIKATFQKKFVLSELPTGVVNEVVESGDSERARLVMQTRNFVVKSALPMQSKMDLLSSNCLSPPQIQRATSKVESQLQLSPDPIFCTQASPSHSDMTNSSAHETSVSSLPQISQSTRAKMELGESAADEERFHGSTRRTNQTPSIPPCAAPRECQGSSIRPNVTASRGTLPKVEWSQSQLTDESSEHAGSILVPVLTKGKGRPSHMRPYAAPRPRQIVHPTRGINDKPIVTIGSQLSDLTSPESPVEAAQCSSFLAALSKFERKPPANSLPTAPVRPDLEEEKTAFGKRMADANSCQARGIGQSERNRRGLELVLGRRGPSRLDTDLDVVDDDDTASVKSIRERFEPSAPKVDDENSVNKIKARFEKKIRPISRSEASKGPLKDSILKFEVQSRRQGIIGKASDRRSTSRSKDITTKKDDVAALEVGETARPSVADRIRAFSAPRQSQRGLQGACDDFKPASADYATSHPRRDASTTEDTVTNFSACKKASITVAPSSSVREIRPDAKGQPSNLPTRTSPLDNEASTSASVTATASLRTTVSQPSEPSSNVRHSAPLPLQPSTYRNLPKLSHHVSDEPTPPAVVEHPQVPRQKLALVSHHIPDHPASSSVVERPQVLRSLPRPIPNKIDSKALSERPFDRNTLSSELKCNDDKHPSTSTFQREKTLQAAQAVLHKHDELLRPVTDNAASIHDLSNRASPDGAVAGDLDLCGELPTSSKEDTHDDDDDDDNESGSEFSDGVTLDLSIADVSNLTTPTALVSRADKSIATDEGDSSDPSSKSHDLIEVEAKTRSEASSSQTSEAAAPLLAKALGGILHPMSDELSANSFFAKRALIANHWSKTSSLDRAAKGLSGTSAVDRVHEIAPDAINVNRDGWDVSCIESSFPLKETTSDVNIFDFESDWQPFSASNLTSNKIGFANMEPLVVETPIAAASSKPSSSNIPLDALLLSGAKTPTRSNITARAVPSGANLRHRDDGLPPAHAVAQYPIPTYKSPRSIPTPPPLTQSAVSLPTRVSQPQNLDPSSWKRRAGVTLSSVRRESQLPVRSIERLPVRLPSASSTTTSNPPNRSSAERYGNRHAAVMDRLRALKEARIRRSSATYAMENGMTLLSDQDDTSQNSTQSSTQFGGSTFLASLEVD